MTTLISRRYALVGALAMTAVRPARATILPPVDVALVLALDVSTSVIGARWELQRGAYRDAFLDPDIIARISRGSIGAIAVTVVEWASGDLRQQVVPWTVVSDQVSGTNFAATLANMPREFRGKTCVGGGLHLSMQLLLSAPFETMKKVIDISGDGIQSDATCVGNQSLEAFAVRDLAVASGIVINGLPILLPENDMYHGRNVGVVPFYEKDVIGGPGSFLVVVPDGNDAKAFGEALKRKLLMEVV